MSVTTKMKVIFRERDEKKKEARRQLIFVSQETVNESRLSIFTSNFYVAPTYSTELYIGDRTVHIYPCPRGASCLMSPTQTYRGGKTQLSPSFRGKYYTILNVLSNI